MGSEDLKSFSIQLDTCNGVYYHGERLSGSVIIHLTKPMTLREIRLQVKGRAVWGEDGRKGGEVEKVLVERDLVLLERPPGQPVAGEWDWDAGRHALPFECPLPRLAPTSFEGPKAFVRYFARATLTKRETPKKDRKYVTKTPFTVLGPPPQSISPELLQPVGTTSKAAVSGCCCLRGSLNGEMGLSKAVFVAGETVYGSLAVENRESRKALHCVTVELVEVVKRETGGSGTTPVRRILVSRRLERSAIAPRENWQAENVDLIKVPPVAPSFRIDGVCAVSYELVLRAGKRLAVTLPLTLGNIPLSSDDGAPPPTGIPVPQFIQVPPVAPSFRIDGVCAVSYELVLRAGKRLAVTLPLTLGNIPLSSDDGAPPPTGIPVPQFIQVPPVAPSFRIDGVCAVSYELVLRAGKRLAVTLPLTLGNIPLSFDDGAPPPTGIPVPQFIQVPPVAPSFRIDGVCAVSYELVLRAGKRLAVTLPLTLGNIPLSSDDGAPPPTGIPVPQFIQVPPVAPSFRIDGVCAVSYELVLRAGKRLAVTLPLTLGNIPLSSDDGAPPPTGIPVPQFIQVPPVAPSFRIDGVCAVSYELVLRAGKRLAVTLPLTLGNITLSSDDGAPPPTGIPVPQFIQVPPVAPSFRIDGVCAVSYELVLRAGKRLAVTLPLTLGNIPLSSDDGAPPPTGIPVPQFIQVPPVAPSFRIDGVCAVSYELVLRAGKRLAVTLPLTLGNIPLSSDDGAPPPTGIPVPQFIQVPPVAPSFRIDGVCAVSYELVLRAGKRLAVTLPLTLGNIPLSSDDGAPPPTGIPVPQFIQVPPVAPSFRIDGVCAVSYELVLRAGKRLAVTLPLTLGNIPLSSDDGAPPPTGIPVPQFIQVPPVAPSFRIDGVCAVSYELVLRAGKRLAVTLPLTLGNIPLSSDDGAPPPTGFQPFVLGKQSVRDSEDPSDLYGGAEFTPLYPVFEGTSLHYPNPSPNKTPTDEVKEIGLENVGLVDATNSHPPP